MRQMREQEVEDSYELLTTREREILQLLAEGKSNKEVATMLNLSLYTVETHRSNIFQKLNLHSTAELILYAVRKGVITYDGRHFTSRALSDGFERSRVVRTAASWRYGLALGVAERSPAKNAGAASGPDSYQLLLGAVAIAVMYSGVRGGAAALAITSLAKLFLFLPRESSLHLSDMRLVVRLGAFLCLGLLICWLG